MGLHDQPPTSSSTQKASIAREFLDFCLAADLMFTLAVLAIACVGAVVWAVVKLDAQSLVFASIGLFGLFCLGCLFLGVRSIGRKR